MRKFAQIAFGEIVIVAISGGAYMLIPQTTHNGYILIAFGVLLLLFLTVFSLNKKPILQIFRGRPMVLCLGIVVSLVGLGLVISQLDFHEKEKDLRSPLQIQLDSLIDDIAGYEETVQAHPVQMEGESWESYTQRILGQNQQVNTEFFVKFNNKIADITNKLHELEIITDTENQEMKGYVNFPSTSHTVMPLVLEQLQTYKVKLDKLQQNLVGG